MTFFLFLIELQLITIAQSYQSCATHSASETLSLFNTEGKPFFQCEKRNFIKAYNYIQTINAFDNIFFPMCHFANSWQYYNIDT